MPSDFAGHDSLGKIGHDTIAQHLAKLVNKPSSKLPRQSAPNNAWHTQSVKDAMHALEASPEGLSMAQATERTERYGPNAYEKEEKTSFLKRVWVQVHNLLIYVLIAASIITWLIDHRIDAIVIFAVVILNISIGLYQEGKAEKSLQAIRQMLAPKANVLRDGHLQTLDAQALVPGDIVSVASGDSLPADLRWINIVNLRVDESALTGESVAVNKTVDAVDAQAAIGDRACMGYAGTLVTQGQGRALVVATGMQTEMGRIGRLLEQVEANETPLVRNMAQFSRWLTFTILVFAVLLLGYSTWLMDAPLDETFMAVVGLAVAAIPEGLPAILTITLAIGVQRMARRHAVIRRLPAVETLGAVNVICSDKTGTLTRNEMTAQAVTLTDRIWYVQGEGYGPDGEVKDDSEESFTALDRASLSLCDAPAMTWIAVASALCNDAELRPDEQNAWQLSGDPTEGALLALAMKLGVDLKGLNRLYARTCAVPFESEHRFMVTGHLLDAAGEQSASGFILVKGAPEKLLHLATDELTSTAHRQPVNHEHWSQAIDEHAKAGRRVLAIAIKTGLSQLDQNNIAEQTNDLTFVGIIGIMDPPREEAISSVELCKQAGIQVKMITGDHAGTALAIANALGIGDGKHVLVGSELERLSDEDLRDAIGPVDVFARASPEHKIRIVKALQVQGNVVAMTGDGVNDSPALKQADIGIAMGKKGTEAAKQASEIVLADDNFASIVNAVEEGRTVYDNLKKTIAFLLPINGGESMAIGAAILLGVSLPITPLQILWVNMVSSIGLAMVLAFEAPEPDIMRRKPRNANEPLLSRFLIWRILFVSSLFLIGIFGVYHWSLSQGESIEVARTMAVNALVSMEVFYLFSVRYLKSPSFTWIGVQGTPRVLVSVSLVVALQFAMTYWSAAQHVFETRSLSWEQLATVVLVGVTLLVVLEFEKLLLRRDHKV
jgi:magnesium-transporting ATPase (P-type)